MSEATGAESKPTTGGPLEVLAVFLRLGLTAFGGPIAHLGYFREEFVARRRWLNEAAYADLVALCQFLPGPSSSQVGFGIGLLRAGPLGALAAWAGFTLPSAILMTAFAFGAAAMGGPIAHGAIHGLKLVAVAVVAHAVFGMAKTLTPDARRAGIAVGPVAIVTLAPAMMGQIAAIGFGALAGFILCRGTSDSEPAGPLWRISPKVGIVALAAYLLLIVGAPVLAASTGDPTIARFSAFYRSGALVFGGGHVVLPLLERAVVDPGWVSPGAFLAGYGAAQAMPGPLFTFAAYLGAAAYGPPNRVAGAALGLFAVFLPGLLVLLAALPFWSQLRSRPAAQATMRGANAAVVGLLAVALYNPVWISAVLDPIDFACVLSGFALLTAFKAQPVVLVILGLAAGVARAV
ncbi:chromate efflux transporter [Caulobacter sp. S45]|uniref:chromate efflux transporter n=1 Tax=Caulobacter sp. S45 TaxID=1641861 RepID=UPI00131C89A6|nr:chromate efflux transporter [Caulobacter sp. S45]